MHQRSLSRCLLQRWSFCLTRPSPLFASLMPFVLALHHKDGLIGQSLHVDAAACEIGFRAQNQSGNSLLHTRAVEEFWMHGTTHGDDADQSTVAKAKGSIKECPVLSRGLG